MTPDGFVDDDAAGTHRVQQHVQHHIHRGALEAHVRALAVVQFADLGGHVHLARVEGLVHHAGLEHLLPPQLRELGDVHRQALALEHGRGERADGAGAADQRHARRRRAGPHPRVVGHGERLDERGLVEGHGVGHGVDPAAPHRDLLGQAAAVAAQADEVHVRREVVVRSVLVLLAHDVRLHDDLLADLEVRDALAQGGDGAGHLVAERDGGGVAGDRVRVPGRRDEDRALEVLVQVRAADAAPRDVHEDLPRTGRGRVDLLDADVLLAVPTGGAHGHAGRPPGWGWSRVPGRRAGAPAPVLRASHRAGLPGQARGPCGGLNDDAGPRLAAEVRAGVVVARATGPRRGAQSSWAALTCSARQRIPASTKSSMWPSNTEEGLPSSWPVRRSLTIWYGFST